MDKGMWKSTMNIRHFDNFAKAEENRIHSLIRQTSEHVSELSICLLKGIFKFFVMRFISFGRDYKHLAISRNF